MKTKKICKFVRGELVKANQYRLCTGGRCDYAENVAYHWRNVTCKKCRAKAGK